MINIDGLRFRYPHADHEAIADLSLHIETGSLFGLLGPNGSGKTTLLSLLTGLLKPLRGRIDIDGKPLVNHLQHVRQFSALVPQEYAFYSRLNVAENLAFFAGALNLTKIESKARIKTVVATTGLEHFLNRRAAHLSGGLKRRLNLAIGLLNQPRLLFLDEPTVGIDPQSRHFILEAIKQLNADGTTIIYTTHYMEEVERLCERIAVLDQGRVLTHGTLDELLSNLGGQRLTLRCQTPLTPQQQQTLKTHWPLQCDDNTISIDPCPSREMHSVLTQLSQLGIDITRMRYGHSNLEELFLHLTGRGLRE